MMGSSDKREELLQEAVARGLYEPLVAQLQKDFGRANAALSIPADMPPEALGRLLHETVYLLLMERFSDYLNVLYVVDVPERSFKEIPLTDAVDIAFSVSYLILEREWQKVRMKAGSDPRTGTY